MLNNKTVTEDSEAISSGFSHEGRTIGAVSSQTTDAELHAGDVIKRFTKDSCTARRWKQRLPSIIAITSSVLFLAFEVLTYDSRKDLDPPLQIAFLAVLVSIFVVSPIVGRTLCRLLDNRRITALDEMVANLGTHTVGCLVETSLFDSSEVRRRAEKHLKALLPRVSSDDPVTITPEQRRYIVRVFRRLRFDSRKADFGCALLEAYQRIGDASAIPVVRELAAGTALTPANVRDAAERCLPYLEERSRAATDSNQLLRSALDSTSETVLLRPITGLSDVHTDVLLRPPD